MSPNEQRLRSLYNKAVQHFSLPDFEKFVQDIQNPDVLEKVREGLSEYYNVPSSEQMMEDLFNIVPGKEDRINSAVADKLPEPDMDLAKTMFEAIDNKDEESGFLPPEEISMVADQVVQPVYNINAIQQDLENPLVAAEIKHEQDKYDKLSPVDQFEFREPETAAKLKPLVEEYRQTLSNINESDEEYKKTLLANFIEEDLSEPTSEGEKLNLETVNLPDAPTPMERLDRLVGTNAVDRLFIDDEKPAWMSDQVYQEVKHYKETGEISDSVIDKASDQLKTQTLNKVKSDKLNAFYHANKDLTQTDRNKLTALLADQVEGGLDFKSVMDLSNNPSLMDLQAKNIQLRSSEISKKMKSIQEQQDELDNNEQFLELNSQAEEIQKQLDVMDKNGISNDSPESIKKEYNGLLASYNGVIDEYKSSGLLDKREKLAEDIIAWNKERDSLLSDSNELGDVSLSLELATKNFSSLDKAILAMEQSFLGATASTVGTTLGMVGEVIDETIGEKDANALSSFLNKVEGVALDYNESLQQEMAVAMAPKPSMSDAWDAGALSGYISQSFAEGTPSIATVLMTRFGGKMSSPSKKAINKASGPERFKLQAKANVAQARASKIAQGIFFNMSYGLKGSEINIAQRNAPKAIMELEKKLDSGLLSPFEIAETKNQIEELNRVKDLNVLQKAGSQLISGSVDMYSERLGTLSYMKNLNRIAAPVGSTMFKKAMYQGLNLGINVGTEIVEETAAQIGNNLSDIYILGENKSILDGIDAEFAFNVGLTSLAIQGPSIGSNLYAMLGDNVKTKRDYEFDKSNFDRLIEIENSLNDGTKRSKKEKQILKAEQDLILEQAAFRNIENVEKLSALSEAQQIELFDLISQRKKYISNLRELGDRAGQADPGSKAIKKQKQQFVNEYKSVDTQIEKLLNTRRTKAAEDQKNATDPAMAAYHQGLFEFYNNTVGVSQELNGKKYTEVDSQTTVEELRELYGDRAEQLIEARNNNQNATFIGEDIIIFRDNIARNIGQTADKYVALLSAVAPIHELQHIQNRKAGIVKDGVVVESTQLALEQAEKQLEINKETGKISQEDYNNFLNRKQAYTSSIRELQTQLSNGEITKEQYDDLVKNKGVDVEEVLNLFGDMVAAGVLSKYDFNKISGLKYMLKSLANKFNPKTGFLIPLKTGDDVFNYIKSFQRSVKDFNLQAGPPEDETDGKLSKGPSEEVQRLYDEQGEAAAFDIIEQFKPITNKIVQRRSEAPGFDRQLLTDEIETGERGILDLIRAYDPESGVPLAAYINKFLPSRAIEASKRVLGEEFTDDITEQVGLAAIEESDSEVLEKPKRKIKLKKRLTGDIVETTDKIKQEIKNLPIEQLSFKTLKDVALEEVQKLFGIKPKPGNLTKQDVANAQQYINKNAQALITMLPEGATPSGTSTGVQKVLLDNFYNKTERAKMSKTGSKAGLAIYEKRTDITPAEFKEVFGITPPGQPNLSDRNTSARIKSIVAQTERMLTNQEVREELEKQGRNIPQALTEGKSQLMFSQGPKLSKAQIKILDKARKSFESNMDYGPDITSKSYWNAIIKYYGYEPINLNTLKGKQKLEAIIFEGIDGNEPLIRFLPKSFITDNRGTWSNGGMYETIKDENGRPILLEESERKFLSENGFRVKANEPIKRFKLRNGETVLNTDKEFVTDEIQLQIMPGMGGMGNNRFIFANGLQIDEAIRRAEELAQEEGVPAFAPENTNINLAIKRTGYSKLFRNGFTKEFNADQQGKRKGLKDIFNVFDERIQADPKTYIPAVAAILSATSQGQGHFMRKGSIVEFLNDLGFKNVEEHTQPASFLAKFLFDRMVQNNYDLYVDNALKTFFQGPLPELNDNMLKGEGFNYTEAVDKKYRLDVLKGKIPIWIRYFNPFVNKQKITLKINGKNVTFTGVDPNRLFLSNGNSISKEYDLDVDNDLLTPSVVAKQQDLLFKIFTGELTQQAAKQRLNKFLNTAPGLKASKGVNINNLKTTGVLSVDDNMTSETILEKASTIDVALQLANKLDQPIKKIRVFDFDDTIAESNSLVFYTKEDGTIGELTAEQFASDGAQLVEQGAVMDFSDFDIVRDGRRGPLFDIAKKIKDARGNEDLFILTARSPLSQDAIYEFLKSEGLEFKKENIIGLGNSTGEAKAEWLVGKAAEGYNDFYFADDAAQNVDAVKKAMNLLDVKSKVQLVKQNSLKFSRGINNLQWETDAADNMKTTFNIDNKEYNFNLYSRDDYGSYDVEFDLDGKQNLTNTGDAVKVIRTVYNGLLDAVNQNTKIKKLEFSSLKSEQSRVKLYTTLMDKVAKKLGWKTDIWESNDFITPEQSSYDFEITKPKKKRSSAVSKVLKVVDIKSQDQQAKLKFSQGLDQEFDQLITMKKDPMFKKEISKEKGRLLGKDKDSFKFFIPYSAEDLVGLIYPTLAKGPLGNLQMSWYKKHLLDPLAKADGNLRADRLQLINDFKKLKKDLNIPKDLNKSTSIGGFTKEQAIRVYLWYKNGITNIPGVNAEDLKEMTEIIENDPQLIEFAEELLKITKGDGWSEPASGWTAGTLSTDIQQLLNTTKRYKYYEDFNQRIDKIYSEANLNKLEAMYGRKYRDALENMIKRIKTGKNRSSEGTRLSNRILDYINGSNAAIMFLNTRSAVLQTISAINYVNWNFNNPLKAGAAFANQPQYWKDFMTLMNSYYLKDRRQCLRINVTESEIADAAKTAKNKAKGAIAYIMEKGYAPTQFADSFAIAAGGATYYRNRINDLMENSGLDEKQATEQALREWKEISEESQQSSRPDKISQQQSSDYGRLILMFANTPMQYARIQKRSIQDLIAGRGDWKTNVSKIAYYGFVQNLIFNSLQNALFAIGAGDGDDDEDDKKVYRTINGMSDSMLRGLGIGGASASVVKNLLLDIYERSKRSRPEYVDATWKLLQFSPPISSKISKIRGAAYQFDSKKRRQEMIDKGFAIDNPAYLAGAKVVSATTNIPLDRALLKYDNFTGAFEEEKEWWESVAMILGWPEWQLKSEKKQSSRSRSSRTKSSRSSSNRNKSKRR